MLLQILCILSLLGATAVCLYYYVLAIASAGGKPLRVRRSGAGSHSFAIIIPAHNEEKKLPTALASCRDLDYPRAMIHVSVVADNCTDRTAEVARYNGVECLERSDPTRKGKGFALRWALERILPRQSDVVLILDADCRLDPRALRVFDDELSKGHDVIQAKYTVSNPDESAVSYLLAVGNMIENDLFCSPKMALGLPILLRGTGMVFRREILDRYPWSSYSTVEDVEYSLTLLRNGVIPRFAADTYVSSEFPSSENQLQVQRVRWANGNLGAKHGVGVRILKEGLATGNRVLLEAGWSLLAESKPLILLYLSGVAVLVGCTTWLIPGELSAALMVWGVALLLGFGSYLGAAVVRLGLTVRRVKLLGAVPRVVGRLMLIALLGVFGVFEDVWVQRPRG